MFAVAHDMLLSRERRRRVLAIALFVAFAADGATAAGQRGIFDATGTEGALEDPWLACDLHREHPAVFHLEGNAQANASQPPDLQLNYTSLCEVRRYSGPPSTPAPAAQYPADTFLGADPSDHKCKGTKNPELHWPACAEDVDTSDVDFGYRYPILIVPFERNYQIPGGQDPGDWWPVCVSANVSDIYSDPEKASCGDFGVAGLEEIGRCIPAGPYYEKLASGGKRPAERFFSFVLSHRSCDPMQTTYDPQPEAWEWAGYCAHDVVSAVDACMKNCEKYLGGLRYEPQLGWWVTTNATTDTPAERVFLASEPGHTFLTQCRSICGPPYDDAFACSHRDDTGDPLCPDADGDGDGDFAVHDTPPWISAKANTQRLVSEKENHWHFVQYGRSWNPNTRLANWLRSYSVNRDKPYAPVGHCQQLVAAYCDETQDADDVEPCKRMELGPGDPAAELFFDPRLPDDDKGNAGFCRIAYRGSILCPESCHIGGGDADSPLGRNLCGVDLPADFRDERETLSSANPFVSSLVDDYMSEFECSGASARCQVKRCPDTGPRACRTVAALHPEKRAGATPWPTNTIEGAVVYVHSKWGEIFPDTGVTATWEVRVGIFEKPNDPDAIIDRGPLVRVDSALGQYYTPGTYDDSEFDSEFGVLDYDTVHRIDYTFELPMGKAPGEEDSPEVVPLKEFVKFKTPPEPAP